MEPKHFKLTLKSGEKLHAWSLNPSRMARAVICLCHGWGEHSERYIGWAKQFASYDYAVVAWDHYGHGQSEGKRGHIPRYEVFLEEVNLAINKANELYPSTPVVLYGHSMGGNIAINFALKESNPFQLLIATSPWLKLVNEPAKPMKLLVKVLNRLTPGLQIAAPLDAAGISHVPEEVNKYKTDPLNHGKITPRLLTGISEAGEYAIKHIGNLNKPFLLVHGDADPVTLFQASNQLFASSKTCSFVPFKDMFHELHNETVRDEVFRMIKEWLSGNLEY